MKYKEYIETHKLPNNYSFTEHFNKKETVYYVRVLENLGVKELHEMRIRTLYDDLLVGVLESKQTMCVFKTTASLVFKTRKEALEAYNAIKVPKVTFTKEVNE